MVIHAVGQSMVTEAVTITKVDPAWSHAQGDAVGFLAHSGQAFGAATLPIYRDRLRIRAERYWHGQIPVHLQIVTAAATGRAYVKDIARAVVTEIGCVKHRWDWATGTIMKCRRCGLVQRNDRA